MAYQPPTLIAHGMIAEHTFGRAEPTGGCSGQADPPKDHNECKLDCFGEWSCS